MSKPAARPTKKLIAAIRQQTELLSKILRERSEIVREQTDTLTREAQGRMLPLSYAVANALLLGATFLGSMVQIGATLDVSQVDAMRAAIALDVVSFTCFLISLTARLCALWFQKASITIKQFSEPMRPSGIAAWFRHVQASWLVPGFFFLGLLSLAASVACVIQGSLGTAAHAGDTLAICILSFLSFACVFVLCVVALNMMFIFGFGLDMCVAPIKVGTCRNGTADNEAGTESDADLSALEV